MTNAGRPAAPPRHTLVGDLVMGESPRWDGDRLWVSDMGARQVVAVDLTGRSEVVARIPSGLAGIGLLPGGQLLVVASGDERLLRLELDGSLVSHADLGGIFRPHWNDLVVDGRGNAYVSNVGFDFPAGEFAPGIVALVYPTGTVRQVADGLAFPNGLAVTPDNATLIVAESYGSRLTAFDIATDGSLSNQRVWADSRAVIRTASASTPKARSGSRTSPRSGALGSAKVARSSSRSISTAAASRARSAGPTAGRCSWWSPTGHSPR